MKGLILKDLYMTAKYCKAHLLIIAASIGISLFVSNVIFIFYPCLMSGIVPMTLLSYDERSKWSEYCGTMPISAAQIVSTKYIIGLICSFCVLILSGTAQEVKMNHDGVFQLGDWLNLLAMLLIMSCVAVAVTLPFIFRFGVEKGRIAYYLTIAIACGVNFAASDVINFNTDAPVLLNVVYLILCIIAVAIYALSWYLSIVFYKKRLIK
ncbi:MAG: ABC-2 transporter permease [Oscillospiraceae bacterium]|nr:ABC-2 transporter permease [Oscillospiraceae bacterium]